MTFSSPYAGPFIGPRSGHGGHTHPERRRRGAAPRRPIGRVQVDALEQATGVEVGEIQLPQLETLRKSPCMYIYIWKKHVHVGQRETLRRVTIGRR